MHNIPQVQTLRAFNSKVARLERTSFKAWLESAALGWSFRKAGSDWYVEWDQLDEESTDAFLLTLRFFVQDRDGISLGKIAELYESLPVEENLRKSVRDMRERLKEYLESNSGLISGDHIYSRYEVFGMFLWGDRAHLNPAYRTRIEPWLNNVALRALLETEFARIVRELLRCILWQRATNEDALAQLVGN